MIEYKLLRTEFQCIYHVHTLTSPHYLHLPERQHQPSASSPPATVSQRHIKPGSDTSERNQYSEQATDSSICDPLFLFRHTDRQLKPVIGVYWMQRCLYKVTFFFWHKTKSYPCKKKSIFEHLAECDVQLLNLISQYLVL